MWTSLILSLLLVHCLVALPAPESNDLNTESWNADEACQEVDKSVMIANQNDSTCTSFVYCYITNGSPRALVKSCKSGQYFDAVNKFCTINKPEGCK
ncbi:uncharacterized protein LOC108098980 [Drosophila ficusphila]|uniref:uncharacterized protein LOC108098980 n=1 Tax=Drosophila ficusphila TaxID=30025 RepID=UPI0007E7BA17|nr:uncharacterized protein LOC108098980 [Drosophila ficusphila]